MYVCTCWSNCDELICCVYTLALDIGLFLPEWHITKQRNFIARANHKAGGGEIEINQSAKQVVTFKICA